MKNPTEIQVALLSSMLIVTAHPSRGEGGLRYSAFILDGNNTVLSHHFAIKQPFIRDNVLVMDSSEIRLHDGATLVVEDFLKCTAASFTQSRSCVESHKPRMERASA
jgi:hypothetical protein